MSDPVLVTDDGGVRIIRMNRPEKKNALTQPMYAAMTAALDQAGNAEAIRCIVIAGAPGAFCAGSDIGDFQKRAEGGLEPVTIGFLHALARNQKPLVASVGGIAVGIGTTMLLHCDLVYAGENAHFVLPFVNLGLCPEAASSVLLPRLVGYQRAAQLLMLGEPFTAAIARELGMVTEIRPDANVIAHAKAQAALLAQKPPKSLRITKQLMKTDTAPLVKLAMQAERDQFSELLYAPEAKEAFKAFFEKRKADFSSFN
jgi:enoyl-CoA hydratase/carnithine racemase